MSDFWVNGIVSARDNQPYIQLSNENGMIAQLSMGQARTIAHDILVMASRTEADALLINFLGEDKRDLASALLIAFRDFRHELDMEVVEQKQDDPDGPEAG